MFLWGESVTTTPSSGRHRRRTRIALPVAAAGIAAAVAAAVMTSSAGAATAVPAPTVEPAIGSPSLATLEKRIAGALAGDDTAGRTTEKSSPSSGTNTSSVEPMIIGGSETTLGTAPWMAQLWYHDDRSGTFGSRFSARTGWNQYNSVRDHGDFTGDGKADLLARQSGTGDLYLYKGTGKSGSEAFSSRIKVRSAWTGYNAFDAVGDISGDGLADFLARTPGGTLYLYKGTAKANSEIFATRVSVGNGFQQYDIWG
jgi:hypothetical protein